jgi:hypothetical protein
VGLRGLAEVRTRTRLAAWRRSRDARPLPGSTGIPVPSKPRSRATSRGPGARSSARTGWALPGVPFRRRPGFPARTVGRPPSRPAAPLLASRAPSGHTPEDRRRPRRPDGALLGFSPLQRMRSCGFGDLDAPRGAGRASGEPRGPPFARTHGPRGPQSAPDSRDRAFARPRRPGNHGLPKPATVRPRRFARPRRLTPRNPARVCFAPVTLLGLSSSGPCSAPTVPDPSSRSGALVPLRFPLSSSPRGEEREPSAPER